MSYYEESDLSRFPEMGKFRGELMEQFFKYYGSVTATDGALTKREKALRRVKLPSTSAKIRLKAIRMRRNCPFLSVGMSHKSRLTHAIRETRQLTLLRRPIPYSAASTVTTARSGAPYSGAARLPS